MVRCMELFEGLTGKRPRGYRAPLYTLRGHTIKLLEEFGFLYDSSLAMHDSKFCSLPKGGGTPIVPPEYTPQAKAADWMKPLPQVNDPPGTVVEIPGNWYTEDMTPMQFWPHTANSHGYVPASAVEAMWTERLEFLLREVDEEDSEGGEDAITVFPLILHPDTSGNAHVLPMIERFLRMVLAKGEKVEFVTFGDCAEDWKRRQTEGRS